MPVDRMIFSRFREGRPPTFYCPECQNRTVLLELKSDEADLRLRCMADWRWPGYVPGEFDEREFSGDPFQAWVKCHSPGCFYLASVHGRVDSNTEEDDDGEYYTYVSFRITGFTHSPRLIVRSEKTPQAIEDEISKAEALVWLDPSASASKIRSAIERLMDHEGVPQTRTANNGKVNRLSLNERLRSFMPNDTKFQDTAEAIRWLGNTGTHENLKRSDALDAFDFLEYIIARLYDARERSLLERATKINKQRGPSG